ncbi:uncharacterized protein METZ01_LOCUS27725 [marine metagenome]|uniref:Uncharacterized protein n=1 Tax=marine metagenome TaxID=408172 RepID=A0A381Q6A4_9ZZZZ
MAVSEPCVSSEGERDHEHNVRQV